MRDFEYVAPDSVEGAVAVLAEHGDRAKVLAGGTDLIVQLREGLREADVVVDVKKIHELEEIAWAPDGSLRLGAAVPFHRIWADPNMVDAYPALTDASRIVGGWQIQGRATPGGNVCHSSPAADTTPALMVEQATCTIAGPSGRRSVTVAEFCTGPGRNVLGAGELLVSFDLPPAEPGSGSRYLRFIPRNEMDIAVAGAGAWLRLGEEGRIADARLALAAVAPRAVDATAAAASLIGSTGDEQALVRAAELAREVVEPISDMRGPAAYRMHLAGVLVERALRGALERARGGDRSPVIPVG